MTLYHTPVSLPAFPFPLMAVDSETTLIPECRYDPKHRTRHSPFVTPTLILGSTCICDSLEVLRPEPLADRITSWLDDGGHLVFHNVAFDYNVLILALPRLRPLLDQAIESGRVHDTVIMELLVHIARGSNTIDDVQLKTSHLADLAKRRANMTLNKDADIRLHFDRFANPACLIPPEFLQYAAQDALATYRVFHSQWRESSLYCSPVGSTVPIRPDAEARFGRLTESIQVKGAIALHWLEQFPLRVDVSAVEALRSQFHAEAEALEHALVSVGLASFTKRTRQFRLSHVRIREAVSSWAAEHRLIPPLSNTGLISLSYDFWAEALPRGADLGHLLSQLPGGKLSLEDRLQIWLRYCRLHKLLATYLDTYATSPTHYPTYYNIGARTTRTSCVRPNVQNVPKHRDGIRSLFVPSEGQVFIEADYSAAELVALAQIYHDIYGGSPLGDAINAGLDPHTATAERLAGDKWALYTPDERKRLRQLAKAVNFGLPGGLGAVKFAKYASKVARVPLSEDAARLLRRDALIADPALRSYLSDRRTPEAVVRLAAKNLGLNVLDLAERLGAARAPSDSDDDSNAVHWRLAAKRLQSWRNGDVMYDIPTPPAFQACYDTMRETACNPVGFVRGKTIYTAAHNTPFQSLVACGVKLGLWNLYQLWTNRTFSWSPVCFVHDSLLAETHPDSVHTLTEQIRDAMARGLQDVCPDIKVRVDVSKPMTAWGTRTDALGRKVE